MSTRRLVGLAAAAVLVLIVVVRFGGAYSLECGPLTRTSCEDRAQEIVSVVAQEFARSPVASIVILDVTGHATVLLRNGTRLDVIGDRATEQMV